MIKINGQAVEEGDCITDDESEMDTDSEVVWAKSAQGTWRIGHTFGDKLYFTRDILEEKWVPKKLVTTHTLRNQRMGSPPPPSFLS